MKDKKWLVTSSAVVFTAATVLAGGFANAKAVTHQTATKNPITIGIINTTTGPLGPYGQEYIRGFQIGLMYATGGTNKVDGRPIKYIVKDDGGDPNQAVQDARQFLQNDHVDILAGTVNSASGIAVEPLAAQYHTVFVVGPAVADSITGQYYNKYVFKVSRNSYMDAKSAVLTIAKKGATVAQLAPNYSFGWDSVAAFKQLATKAGMKDVLDVYASPTATDFTPELERIIQAHPQYLFVTWAGAPGPWQAIQQMKLQQQGITIETGIPNIAAIQALFQGFQGMRGFTDYYYTLPHNAANNYLIKEDKKMFNTVPDLFDPDGMAAAISIVDGIKRAGGSTNSNALIKAMSGMTFYSAKGKYYFRPQDHQALQVEYGVVLKNEKGFNYPVPVLTKVFSGQELAPPILNKK